MKGAENVSLFTIIFRLFLAVILGGLIGIEREEKHRPAGFRTHILVCVGSAVVMLTSVFIFDTYRGMTNADPARLGAQVISGIGFLGAGTIIRQGSNVKGLTTAASLWAVACIGLALGIGFYEGAIAGALLIIFTLMVLGRFGRAFSDKTSRLNLLIVMNKNLQDFGYITSLLGKFNISIKDIKFYNNDNDVDFVFDNDLDEDTNNITIRINLKLPMGVSHKEIITQLNFLQGIYLVQEV
jgi:putative Mg2+ transporter-C (MgtC) family protein